MSFESELRADADRYSAMCVAGEELAAAEAEVTDEIVEAFTVTLTKMPAKALAVPTTDRDGWKEVSEPMVDAITDTISGYVDAELFAVLEKSACPHVAALRLAMAKSWASRNAADVAGVRVDQ
jgi:hypothetical protein